MMKSIVAGESDHSSPTVWHIKEDLYCGVIPHLYIDNYISFIPHLYAICWSTNCALPPAWKIWIRPHNICCV